MAAKDPYRRPEADFNGVAGEFDELPGIVQQGLFFLEMLVGGCQWPDGSMDGLARMQSALSACANAVGQAAGELDDHAGAVTSLNAGEATDKFKTFAQALSGGGELGGLRFLEGTLQGLASWVEGLQAQKRAARLQFELSCAFVVITMAIGFAWSWITAGASEAAAIGASEAEGFALKTFLQRIAVWAGQHQVLSGALVGAWFGGGMDAAGQYARIHEGVQKGWNWGEFGKSVGMGAVAGGVMGLAGRAVARQANPLTTKLADWMGAPGMKGVGARFGFAGTTGTAGNLASQAIFDPNHMNVGQAAAFGFGMAGFGGAKELGQHVAGRFGGGSQGDGSAPGGGSPPDPQTSQNKPLNRDDNPPPPGGGGGGGRTLPPGGTTESGATTGTGPHGTALAGSHETPSGGTGRLPDTPLTGGQDRPITSGNNGGDLGGTSGPDRGQAAPGQPGPAVLPARPGETGPVAARPGEPTRPSIAEILNRDSRTATTPGRPENPAGNTPRPGETRPGSGQGTKPGENGNGTKPGEEPNATKPSENSNATRPGEGPTGGQPRPVDSRATTAETPTGGGTGRLPDSPLTGGQDRPITSGNNGGDLGGTSGPDRGQAAPGQPGPAVLPPRPGETGPVAARPGEPTRPSIAEILNRDSRTATTPGRPENPAGNTPRPGETRPGITPAEHGPRGADLRRSTPAGEPDPAISADGAGHTDQVGDHWADDLDGGFDVLGDLPPHQRDAVERLLDDDGVRRLNEALASDDPHVRAEAQAWARDASEGLGALPAAERQTVYHYTSLPADRLAELVPGADVTMHGMLDTASIHTPAHGHPVEIVIHSRSGADVSILTGRDQVVFRPETRFRVLAEEHIELPLDSAHDNVQPIHRIFVAELPSDGTPLPGTTGHPDTAMHPQPMDQRLRNVYDIAREETPAGVAYFHPDDQSHAALVMAANQTTPVDGVFTLDLHANSSNGRAGTEPLTGRDIATLLSHEPRFAEAPGHPDGDGRPVVLRSLGCRSGQGMRPLAQEIANETGRIVIAPDNEVWVDSNGSPQVSAPSVGADGRPIPMRFPPEGAWRIFIPEDGRVLPQGHEPAPGGREGGETPGHGPTTDLPREPQPTRPDGPPSGPREPQPARPDEPPPHPHELRRNAPEDGAPSGHGEPPAATDPHAQRREELAQSVATGIDHPHTRVLGHADTPSSHFPTMAKQVELVTFNDGTHAVRKEMRVGWEDQADREELGALVGGAVEAPVPRVYRESDRVLYMDYIEGDSAFVQHPTSWDPSDLDHLGYQNTRGGKLLGLLDLLIQNSDRHNRNWIITDGDVFGIDHNLAFHGRDVDTTANSFSAHFADLKRVSEGHYEFDWKPNDLSPSDAALIRGRLEALRPEFERLGHGDDWYDGMMRRFAHIEENARGETSLLASDEAPAEPRAADDLPTARPDSTPVRDSADPFNENRDDGDDGPTAPAAPPRPKGPQDPVDGGSALRPDETDGRSPDQDGVTDHQLGRSDEPAHRTSAEPDRFAEWGDRADAIRQALPPDGLPHDGNLRDIVQSTPDMSPVHPDVRQWIDDALSFEHPASGLRLSIDEVGVFGDQAIISGEFFDRAGQPQGVLVLEFHAKPDRDPYMKIGLVELYGDNQGRGIGVDLMDRVENLLIAQDVPEITLWANIDIGGYAWVLYGFDFDSRLPFSESGLPGVVEAVNDHVDSGWMSPEGLRQWAAMADRATPEAWGTPGRITAYEISRLGWENRRPDTDGRMTWDGKEILRGTGWAGVRFLEPPEPRTDGE
ncbi:hypothetical protein [Actinoallomurus sp. CA-150999]|uniref:hypothetical protein n=1 Tax=Actinoallomurus sp. CA-150999 TaxID=3239887 RepID=UPI003D8E8FF7